MAFSLRAIIEVIGAPKDHVDEVMKKVLEKLRGEQGITIVREKVIPAEAAKNVFCAFVELEVKIVDVNRLNYFCFHYLPSSVEIVDVDEISLSSREFTNYLNDVLAMAHDYNMRLSNLGAENRLLKKKVRD